MKNRLLSLLTTTGIVGTYLPFEHLSVLFQLFLADLDILANVIFLDLITVRLNHIKTSTKM